MINLSRKPIEKESVEPASRYSYPQLAFKLPALAPGQNSIGTGGQYSTGANSHGNNLHDLDALLVQPNNLLASLVKLFECLFSCVFFFHELLIRKIIESSYFIGPYL
jgi:hypothetical protein